MKNIGIIGPNNKMCTKAIYDFGIALGKQIATKDSTFICGGLGGFMKAVCKGIKQSPNTFQGQTIGFLPSDDPTTANEYIDLIIPTGVGVLRNTIIVQSANILIAAGGGAGTLSEIAFAWQLKKTVLCVTLFDGWAKKLAGQNLDDRQNGLLVPVNSIEEIQHQLTVKYP